MNQNLWGRGLRNLIFKKSFPSNSDADVGEALTRGKLSVGRLAMGCEMHSASHGEHFKN